MLAIPTDPREARAMLEQQTADIEACNARLRPRTSRLSPDVIEAMRLEASQTIPQPAPPKRSPHRSFALRLWNAAMVAFLAGGSEAAK